MSGTKVIGGVFVGLGAALCLFLVGRLWGKADRWVCRYFSSQWLSD